MKKSALIIILIIVVVALGGGIFLRDWQERQKASEVANFDEGVEAGYPILESFPRQCRTPDGRTFTEDIGNVLEKQDMIQVTNPQPNALVSSPLMVTGQARGNWYFEASFPVKILDASGNILNQVPAQAQGDWMTTDFVPFVATISFTTPTTGTGTLVLQNDNPSGLPENAQELHFPVKFQQ